MPPATSSALAALPAPEAITVERLELFAPHCDAHAIAPELADAAKSFGITTPRRVRHWMAQLAVESCGLVVLEERLSYSVEGLCRTWPHRFPNPGAALACAANPKALAAKVYGGRLGNVAPTDGWDFRGRGYIQITGRENYELATKELLDDYVADPDLAADPDHAAKLAGWLWRRKGCNRLADADDVVAVTHAINGGENGLDDRRRQLLRAALIWKDTP